MTSQLNVALICKLTGSLMCLAYYLTFIYVSFYNQALADILWPGAGIYVCTVRVFCARSALSMPSQVNSKILVFFAKINGGETSFH